MNPWEFKDSLLFGITQMRGMSVADILLRSLGFVLIIAMGYTLKKVGFFDEYEYRTISKIVMNITLPSVIIHSFLDFKADRSLVIVIFVSFIINAILLLLGIFFSRKKDENKKILYIINFPGYNIGNFSLPFIQSFVGSVGVVTTCMFDVGNAILVTGLTYVIATSIANTGEKKGIKRIVKQILTSAPLMTYAVMLLILAAGIRLPKIIEILTRTISGGNGFFSMLLVGMMFEIKFKKEYFKNAGIIIITRLIIATFAAVIAYKFLPLSDNIKKVLIILVFSPLTSLAPLYTEKAGGPKEISSFIGAFSIIISIVIIITLINILHL